MTLKIRRFLFYSFVFLFIVAGIVVVSYSRGWRIDFGNCGSIDSENNNNAENLFDKIKDLKNCGLEIQKTGAIFIKTKPEDVTIKINKKLFNDKSGFIQKGTLITELLSKSYRVEVLKDGYSPWEKTLRVKSELVTEAQNIVLIPKEIKKEIVATARIRGDEIKSISSDGKKFILKDTQRNIYYLYDFGDPTSIFNINVNFGDLGGDGEIKEVTFHPFDSSKLIIENDAGLYILDTLRLTSEVITEPEPIVWGIKNPNVFYIENATSTKSKIKKYSLISFNLIIKTESTITELSKATTTENAMSRIALGQPNQISPMKLDISKSQSRFALLNNDGGLYLFYQSKNAAQKIAPSAVDFSFSPDNEKLAFLDKDGKLNILFLDDVSINNPKKVGDTIQFQLEDQPLGIFWYKDSYHLFLVYPEKVIFMEIDDRPPTNSYPILGAATANFYYDESSDFVYFLKGGIFYRFSI